MPTTNGSFEYLGGPAGAPGAESIHEREARERYWRSLLKKVQKGAKIRP